jgi:hypothetical protein
MAYDNSNSGVLFQNRDHAGNPKAPNLKGTGRITIDGREYELDLAAWSKQSERAGKFLSLSIKLKGDRQSGATPPNPRRQSAPAEQPEEEDLAW